MTPEEARALTDLATDFSHGDVELIRRVKASIAKPPRTTEEVGYYVTGKETDFENCFRHLVSLLEPYTTSAEDKYIFEIFPQWIGEDRILKQAPPELVKAFPDFLSDDAEEDAPDSAQSAEQAGERIRQGFVAGVRALEKSFEEAGFPLLSIDTGGGDTLIFANVTPAVANRWRNVVLGHTYDGIELAVRDPMWGQFWTHVGYALFGLDLGEPPSELLTAPKRRE